MHSFGGCPLLWLYILLSIVLLFVLILLLPITLCASYFDSFRCSVYVGFVKIRLYPQKPKKKKKSKKSDKNKAEQKKDKPETSKEKDLARFVDLIKRVAKLVSSVLKDFFSHILIKKLQLSIRIAGHDAADTAVKYGEYCAAVYPAVSIIASTLNCPEYGVDIVPDFAENAKTAVEFELKARVLLFRLIGLVLKHGIKALKMLADLKN